MNENRISELFFNQPLAIHQDMIGPISAIIDRHAEGIKLSDLEIEAAIGRDKKYTKGYEVINGVAVIPIIGVIAKRMNMFSRISGGTSIEQLQKDFSMALEDPQVLKIAFDIDSPGGTVGGVAELSDVIYEARGIKPIESYVSCQMCSAAYWIGSSADKILITKSSMVGSIGVFTVAKDYTVMEHNRGVRSEVIKAGKHKAAGHPEKHLSRDDINVIQTNINDFYELFIEAVSRNRKISMEKAYELGDGTDSIGRKAVDIGLADGLAVLDSIITGNSSGIYAERKPLNINADNENKNEGEENMGKEIKDLTLAELKAENPGLVKAIQDETTETLIADSEKGEVLIENAVKEERERCSSVFNLLKTEEYASYGDLASQCVSEGVDFEASEKKFMAQRLADLKAGAPETPGPGNPEGSSKKGETKETDPYKLHLEKAKAYQQEHGGTLTEALSKTAPERS